MLGILIVNSPNSLENQVRLRWSVGRGVVVDPRFPWYPTSFEHHRVDDAVDVKSNPRCVRHFKRTWITVGFPLIKRLPQSLPSSHTHMVK
jgi:hypothetical protein